MKFELNPYHQGVSDEELLADLLAVAAKLGVQSLTQSKYDEHGRFCAATLKKRFGTWNAALTAAKLFPTKLMHVPPELLIDDIQRVARMLDVAKLTLTKYQEHGRYSDRAIYRHFGSWKGAVAAAKLEPGWNYEISNEELFDNMERVWSHLGRQPTVDEMVPPLSHFSHATYKRRFGGYRRALEAFVAAIDDRATSASAQAKDSAAERSLATVQERRRTTSRTVNWRLRFLTLRRDGFRCKACGRSPAKEPGVELHVDHVVPWSEGGETVIENLQSLCQQCNGGKSDLPFQER